MEPITLQKMQRGFGTKNRPVIGVLWENDSLAKSKAMTACGNHQPDNRKVDLRRYYDPSYFKAEIEKIWKKQWLFACREEDLPEVGDRVPFEVGPLSFIIVRTEQNSFKAFYNSCLHRGTQLIETAGSGDSIRCPYHGWEWHIDGRLNRIPSHWDFPDLSRATTSLREVKAGTWGGFIFINADPDSASLEEALSVMPEHFKALTPEKRYTAARFRKLVPANWKIAQEAFMESYHLTATHPEGIPFNGDAQAQYDIWAAPHGNVGREAVPSAVPSVYALPDATELSAAQAYAQLMKVWHYPDAELPNLEADDDLRAQLGAWHREVYEKTYGRPNQAPDSAMIDNLLYFMFPHFCFWLSESVPFTYQFTPHPTDPEKSYFDVRLLRPFAEGQPRPASAAPIAIDLHESVAEKAPAFSLLGMIFDQDMGNMPRVQKGVKAADPARSIAVLGVYQESLLQHWHALLDQAMDDGSTS